MTAVKKAAKKATPAKRAPRPATVPANAEPAPPVEAPKTVTLQGRVIEVQMPSADQLLVWMEIMEDLEGASAANLTVEQTLALITDSMEIVRSVFVHPVDLTWFRRERVKGTITVQDSAPIILDVLKMYAAEQADAVPTNRAARRAKA